MRQAGWLAALTALAGARAQGDAPPAGAPPALGAGASRFRNTGPARLEDFLFGTDASQFVAQSACAHDFSVAWSAQVGAAAYATPVLSRLPAESGVRVTAATFARYVESVRGSDGHEMPGWPWEADGASFHASPLLVDMDSDGVDELVLVSSEGALYFLRQRTGLPLLMAGADGSRRPLSLHVPRLRVRRDWDKGMHIGVRCHP
ncbi:hypothetical protein T492DRAFT_888526 [Pavlovales sp. CCMP2436]|nr:hypothetical protein T492DRAFT_888526 [Pavlovales sp. CCMP2436]